MHTKLRFGLLFGLIFMLFIGNAYAKPSFGDNCAACHVAPTVTDFLLPSTHDSLTVPISSFSATDTDNNVARLATVTGYMVTTTSTAPDADDAGWQSSPPNEYTFESDGLQSLYGWAKDAVGIVSESVLSTVEIDLSGTNAPPVADAGPDQAVDEGATVTLNGSNSDDSDDGIESFLWEQVDTTYPVTLSDPAAEQPTFTAPEVGQDGAALTFRLTVTDYSGATSSDTCIVNVSYVNIAPVADAGPDQTVAEGTLVTLDGSASSGVDDAIDTFLWEQIDTSGITAQLSDPNAPTPEFTIDDVGADGASLTFQLTVTDQGGLQATDTCVINVTSSSINQAPVAEAGDDQSVSSGAEVALDASGSSDPDGDTITYTWKQTSGTPVTLSATGAVNPTFTAPTVAAGTTETLTFELTVTDPGQLQATDTCSVQIVGEDPPPNDDDDDPGDDDDDGDDPGDDDDDGDDPGDDDDGDDPGDDDDDQDDDDDDQDDDDDGCHHHDHHHHHHHHHWPWPFRK